MEAKFLNDDENRDGMTTEPRGSATYTRYNHRMGKQNERSGDVFKQHGRDAGISEAMHARTQDSEVGGFNNTSAHTVTKGGVSTHARAPVYAGNGQIRACLYSYPAQ